MIQEPGSWVHDNVVCAGDAVVGHGSMIGIFPKATAANRRVVDSDLPAGRIGKRAVVGAFCAIYMDVRIGKDCRIGDHATIREGVRIGDRSVIGTNADIQYGCKIGSDVRVMNGAHITGGTIIGDGTFIGPGAMTANDMHVDLEDYQDRGQVAPIIGRKVFIGVGAILLPGVRIGDGAIIAAGALVTRDVEAGATVLGMPARERKTAAGIGRLITSDGGDVDAATFTVG